MVRLIVYNIEYCEGFKGHTYEYFNLWKMLHSRPKLDEKILHFIKSKKPDIVALVEIDSGSPRSKGKDEGKYFQKGLGFKSLEEAHQYSFASWRRFLWNVPYLNKMCNAFMAKYELFDIKHHFFRRGAKDLLIEASVKCPKKVTLLLGHLSLGEKDRAKQLEDIKNIVNNIPNPVILMGDFNTFNGRKEMDVILENTKLNDAVPLSDEDKLHTFPAWKPERRLDYVLVSKEIKIKKYKVLKAEFSDHLPIMIDFIVKK